MRRMTPLPAAMNALRIASMLIGPAPDARMTLCTKRPGAPMRSAVGAVRKRSFFSWRPLRRRATAFVVRKWGRYVPFCTFTPCVRVFVADA